MYQISFDSFIPVMIEYGKCSIAGAGWNGLIAWFNKRYSDTGCELVLDMSNVLLTIQDRLFLKANSEEDAVMFKLKYLSA